MFLKLLVLIMSAFLGFLGIVKVDHLPDDSLSIRDNYKRLAIYSSLGAFYDVIMFILIGFFALSPGNYGTVLVYISIVSVLLFYAPACVLVSIRTKKRFDKYRDSKYNASRINCLNCSIVFKVLFVLVATL